MCDLCQNMTVCEKRQTLAGRYCSIAPAKFWLSGPNSHYARKKFWHYMEKRVQFLQICFLNAELLA